MRFLIALSALLCVVASRSVEVPSELIDYTNCVWHYGGAGNDLTCSSGYVGVGACGSESSNNCNSASTGLRCCLMKHGSTASDCVWLHGNAGQTVQCGGSRCVHGYCGSGGSDSCTGSSTFSTQCCNSDVEVTGSCGWTYGCDGCSIECGSGRVMAGACGSRDSSQCPGNTHGIYCCNINDRVAN